MRDYDHLSRDDLVRLLRDRDRLESVLHATDVMLALLDPAFDFVWVNAAYAETCRMTPEELIGKNHFALYPHTENEAIFRRVRDTGEKVFYKDKPFEFPDQPERGITYWDWSLTPIEGAKNTVTGLVFSLRETTRFKQAEAALRQSESRYRMLHESLRDAFVQVAMDGRIVECNALYCQMLGYSPEELSAMTYQALTPERWHPLEDAIVREQILPRGYSDVYEKEYRRKDGTIIPVELRTTLARDDTGQPNAMWAIVREIATRKQAEEALQEADRRKDEFLAILAHELRNPLAPLRTGLEIVQRASEDTQAASQALAMMGRQLAQLEHLVDELLDLNRIGQGRIVLRRARVTLADSLDQAVETTRPLIESRGHKLELAVPAEPIVVEADPLRLAQIFANLLNNAAKFTDAGGQLRVSVERQRGEVVVVVADNGVGIPAALLPRVFDLFIQDRSLAPGQSGLGIGLHLVQQLVALHDGHVEARSEGRGRGSAFLVRLPLAEPATTDVPTPRVEAPLALPAGSRRILVVDDNRDVADSLGMLLTLLNQDVRIAYDGLAALGLAADFRPELVLLDIGMPTLDGYETAARLRAQPWGRDIRLVALTGWGQEEVRRRSHAAGFDRHLVKPIDGQALADLLAAL